MDTLKKFMVLTEKTNVFVGRLNVIILFLAVLIITFEVTMRYLFGLPTNWAHEFMTLLFAVQYMFIAGYCHYYREHVRVDAVYISRSPRTRAWMDLFTGLFTYLFIGIFVWTSWKFYWSSQTMMGGGTLLGITLPGERSFTDWGPPLALIKFMMPFGAALLLCQQLVWTIRDMHMALTGKEMS